MFDELKVAFRQALKNFNEELSRDELPEKTEDLIKAMNEEVEEVTTHIDNLELQISIARDQLANVGHEAESCRRRSELARGIGDTETSTMATQYAEKHEEHIRVLRDKIKALSAELSFLGKEVTEMSEKVEETQSVQESLSLNPIRSTDSDSVS